jgi:hypothetical protein
MAMNKIDETLGELSYVFEQAFAQQPTVPEHKIGFHVGYGETSDDTSGNVHQVAAETNVKAE